MNHPLFRYYLYKFFTGIDTATTAFFFTFFYLNGYNITFLVLAIFIYAITCLGILSVIPKIISKIGTHKTFLLHTVFSIFKLFTLYFVIEYHWFYGFFLIQFFNAFHVMFSRIPLEIHFTNNGEIENKGKSIAIENSLTIISGTAGGIIAGYIIDTQGLFLWQIIHTSIQIASVLLLDISKSPIKLLSEKIKDYRDIFPKKLEKSLFFTNIFYPFTRDFLPMWILITVGSFTLGALFFIFRFIISIIINSLIGKIVDSNKANLLYIVSVICSSLFYLIIPFVSSKIHLALLIFTLGLFTIIIEIPFRRNFYYLANKNKHSVEFAIYKEVIIQKSLVYSTMIAFVLLFFIKDWQYLLMLGAISSLAYLYLKPSSMH